MLSVLYREKILANLFTSSTNSSSSTTSNKELEQFEEASGDHRIINSTKKESDYDSTVKFYIRGETVKQYVLPNEASDQKSMIGEFIKLVKNSLYWQYEDLADWDLDQAITYANRFPKYELVVKEPNPQGSYNYYFGGIVTAKPIQDTLPITRYLALFTELPNADGKNYKELEAEGYSRADLNKDYFFQKQVMSKAVKNESGGAISTNAEYTIYFPPTLTSEWADEDTQIQGFGIFETQTSENTDDVPYIWGEVTGESDDGKVMGIPANKVPLFRKGNFKILIH